MNWTLAFGAALIADIVTTKIAISRGKVEGNPIIRRFSNPAEVCRAIGLRGAEWIYLAGAIPHAVASIINMISLSKKGARTLGPCVLLVLSGLPGCTHSSAVLASTNSWAYHFSRYQEQCVLPTPECECRYAALDGWRAALHEVKEAVRRGGGYPLQLEALKEAEKEIEKCQ